MQIITCSQLLQKENRISCTLRTTDPLLCAHRIICSSQIYASDKETWWIAYCVQSYLWSLCNISHLLIVRKSHFGLILTKPLVPACIKYHYWMFHQSVHRGYLQTKDGKPGVPNLHQGNRQRAVQRACPSSKTCRSMATSEYAVRQFSVLAIFGLCNIQMEILGCMNFYGSESIGRWLSFTANS